MNEPRTLVDRLWAAHEIARQRGRRRFALGRSPLHPRRFLPRLQPDEGARPFSVAEPELTFGFADHYVPTRGSRANEIADPEIADDGAHSRKQCGGEPHHVVWIARSAPGHRACGRPRTRTDTPGAADRLRRQPYIHARRFRRLCLRHRRLRSRACADDADAMAEEAQTHARFRRRRRATPGVAAKDIALAIIARSAPMALKATPSNLPAAPSARCRWKAA